MALFENSASGIILNLRICLLRYKSVSTETCLYVRKSVELKRLKSILQINNFFLRVFQVVIDRCLRISERGGIVKGRILDG